MSLEIARSNLTTMPFDSAGGASHAFGGGSAQSSSDMDSGAAGKAGASGGISYGGLADSSSNLQQTAQSGQGTGTGQSSSDESLKDMVKDLMSLLLQALLSQLQKNTGNSSGSDDSSGSDSGTNGVGSGSSSPAASQQNLAQDPTEAATAPSTSAAATTPDTSATATPAASASTPASTATATPAASASTPASTATATPAAAATSSSSATTSSGQSVGSGPYNLNITNTQDHSITVGMFDKDNKMVSKLDLAPGQTGQMKYPADSSLVAKQADSDGNFKDDASRLELYNGYVNTSDIDGRNAAIHATDGKGFDIGDTKSIADSAPADVTTEDSAGNKTIAGYYDGSTSKMKEGANYMIDALSKDGKSATGETYFHPNDDTLGQGQNPMRHTDSMSLDVTFGKA